VENNLEVNIMNILKTVSVSFALTLVFGTAHGQVGRRLGGAIQNAVQNTSSRNANEQTNEAPAAANTNLPIAMTPAEIMAQCPALPAVSQLVNDDNIRASDPVYLPFRAQIDALRENAKQTAQNAEQAAKAAGEQDADRLARQYTGHSQAELDNMSEAETEAMVNQMLSGMGMGNMTIAQIQAMDGKSDDEIMAAMSKGGVTVGGLTVDEIRAMENMTDAQKEAYMKQGDRTQRAQAFANSEQTKTQMAQGENARVITQIQPELHSINTRWQEITRSIERDNQEVARQIAAIDARYAAQIKAIPRSQWHSGLGSGTAGYVFNEAEQKQIYALAKTCRTEQYTLWRNHLIKT
jgi:hypothetical protein